MLLLLLDETTLPPLPSAAAAVLLYAATHSSPAVLRYVEQAPLPRLLPKSLFHTPSTEGLASPGTRLYSLSLTLFGNSDR